MPEQEPVRLLELALLPVQERLLQERVPVRLLRERLRLLLRLLRMLFHLL